MTDTRQTQYEYMAFGFELTAAAMMMNALAAKADPSLTPEERAKDIEFYERMSQDYQTRARHYRLMAVGDYSWSSDEAA